MPQTRFLCILSVLLTAPLAGAQVLWGGLRPGPYRVGFRSAWRLDYGRSYQMRFDDKSDYSPRKEPRPILINVWYPATGPGTPMRYRSYLEIVPAGQPLRKFAQKLVTYDRDVIFDETLHKAESKTNSLERAAFERFLNLRTASIRGARAVRGKFPLLIYHSGYGSSFEDNTILCEYLASHGYVVIGSAYQRLDGSSFNIEGGTGDAEDFEFLCRYGQSLPNVDWRHIGLFGHSGGAQAAIIFQSRPESAVDAIVSLDTTQDYQSLKNPLWNYMTDVVRDNLKRYTKPLMLAADSEASFEMGDTMTNSDRYYLTLNELEHNEFISHGSIARLLTRWLASGKVLAEAKEQEQRVRYGYESLCRCVLAYFDGILKGKTLDPTLREFGGPPKADKVRLAHVPRGASAPPRYSDSSMEPPEPRQIRPYLMSHGAKATGEVIRRFADQRKSAPIYNLTFAYALLYDLIEDRKLDDAGVIHDAYVSQGFPIAEEFLGWAKLLELTSRRDKAADVVRMLLEVEPHNEKAMLKLAELQKSK